MLKRKTNIFVTILFTFVAFMLIGTTNVNAATVTVTNEQELIEALDGVKEVEGSKVTDTTVVELSGDIELTKDLLINPITDLTLDLNGNTIDGKTNKKQVYIRYGSNKYEDFTSGSLTIKDSSTSKAGTIKSYGPIGIGNNNIDEASTKNFKLIIEGGNYCVFASSVVFELSSSDYYMKDKNITFSFEVKDGHFETDNDNVMDGWSRC